MKTRNRTTGFTLLELLIALVIVAILAAIAFPYYGDYVRKSRRVDGENALMEAAQKMEVFYATNATYTEDEGAANISTKSQATNGDYFYDIAIVAADAGCPITSCYRIDATPTSDRDQDKDKVKGFRFWSTGLREHSLDGSSWKDSWVVH